MKFYNLVDKGRWPRGPWNAEPDLVIFQLRREKRVYTCVIKRMRDTGALNGYILASDDHPLMTRNQPGMTVIMAMDAGFKFGQEYAYTLNTPRASTTPHSFDPGRTYFTVDAWKEMLLQKLNELSLATRQYEEAGAASAAQRAGAVAQASTPDEDDDVFGNDIDDEYDEEEDDDDEEPEEVVLPMTTRLTASQIFDSIANTPTTTTPR